MPKEPTQDSEIVLKQSTRFSNIKGMEKKALEEHTIGGFIATTHLDSGWFSEELQKPVRDKIAKEVLDRWAEELNSGIPRANKVSVRHDRTDPVVMGAAIKNSAKVVELPDGEYGLYVDTILDSTHPDYKVIEQRIDIGTIDSFSIEFVANEAKVEAVKGADYVVRHLLPGTELHGYTLASRPMNEFAMLTMKEIMDAVKETKEEIPMEQKESAPEVKEVKVSESDYQSLMAFKAMQEKQAEEVRIKEMTDNILKSVKEQIKEIKVEEKVMQNPAGVEIKEEIIQFKEICKPDTKLGTKEIAKIAGKLSDKAGFTAHGEVKGKSTPAESRIGKYQFEVKQLGMKHVLEYKGLGLTTNQNSDTDYLLSAAELADVFDPVVYNALNQQTVTWNILAKDDFSNKGNNQVQFTLKTAANATAGAYATNAVTTGNVTRLKYQTKFKKYAVGVQVDGDMVAAARGGPIGDVFAQEVQDSSLDLLSVMNAALFAEVGLETASGVIGFEFIADSAGNGTMYGLTRSAANKLSPDSATDTYINGASADISLSNLRKMKRQALLEGANISNLVYITNHIQGDKFRGKYDAIQRTVPTSSRFGFEGRPEFDGIPVFEDKDCNTDDWYLVDLETHRIAIWVPPTLEMFGKTDDSTAGFIKSYWCTYNRAPRRLGMCYGNATA